MTERNRVMDAASQLGGTAVMQYWNDVVNVSLALSERQVSLWSSLWQQAMSGGLSPESAREDGQRMWAEWLHAVGTWTMFPAQWWLRWIGDVPTTVFVLDDATSSSGVQSVATPSVIAQLALGCTDLQLVAGPRRERAGRAFTPGDPVLPAEHVLVTPSPFGERVEVQIVNLRPPPGPEDRPQYLDPPRPDAKPPEAPSQFQYVGVLFAQELQVRRPIALVVVVFLPAENCR